MRAAVIDSRVRFDSPAGGRGVPGGGGGGGRRRHSRDDRMDYERRANSNVAGFTVNLSVIGCGNGAKRELP